MRLRYLLILSFIYCFLVSTAGKLSAQSPCIDQQEGWIDSILELTYTDALPLFHTAITSSDGDIESKACLYYYFARMHFGEGFLDSALHYFSGGAELLNGSETNDPMLWHKLNYNCGIVLLRQRQYNDAIPWFKSAREYAISEVDVEKCHIKIAKCYRESGDLFLANHYLKIAAQKLSVEPSAGLKWLMEAYGTLGINYNESHEADSAKHYLQKQRRLIEGNHPSQWISASITNHIEMGNAYESLEDYDEAVKFYKASLRQAKQEGDVVNQYRNYNNIGYAYNQDGKFLEAIVHLRKSRKIAKEILRDSVRLSYVESTIGDTYLESGVYDRAIDQYYRALVLITPGFTSDDYSVLPSMQQIQDLDYLKDVYGYCSDLAGGLGDYGMENGNISMILQALQYVDLADSILFVINQNSIEDRSKFFWRTAAKKLYTRAIVLAEALEDFGLVFHYMERNKYFVLRSLINENSRLRHAAHEDQKIIGELRETISQAEIQAEVEGLKGDQLAAYIELKEELHARINFIETGNEELVDEAIEIDLEEFRNELLKNDSTLYISYHIADGTYYMLYIGMDSIWMKKSVPSVLLSLSLKRFVQQVSQPFQTTSDEEEFYALANYLFNQLLPDLTPYHSLIINPDGILNYLPFDALCTNRNQQKLVIEDQTVRYMLTPYIKQSAGIKEHNGKTLLIAPVDFAHGLSSLPYTKTEVQSIARIVKGKKLTGNSCSKEQFLDALPQFDNIHLATHAQAGSDNGSLPWLAMGDQKIYLPEIYHLPFDDKFVVLSACETFKGEEIQGEGILNLVWAFHYAGARNVVATLWNAYDNSQNDLMEIFYQEMKSGKSQDDALRSAKLHYKKNFHNDPCYWASPIYIGEPAMFKQSSSLFLMDGPLKFLAIFLVIGIMGWMYLRFQK